MVIKLYKERSLYNRWSCQSNSATLSVTEFWTHDKTPILFSESLIYIAFTLLVMMKAFVSVQKLSYNDEITAFMSSTTCL